MNVKIPSSGVIDQETINPHDLCYQCSKYGPDFLFGKLRMIDFRYETCFTSKIKLLSSQIKTNAFFKNINVRKRSICDKNTHNAMWIPVNIYQRTKKFFVTLQPKNVY